MTAAGSSTLELISPGRGVAVERAAQLGQRHAGLAELLEHHEGGDGARVGPPVVAEVVVRGVLAAEGGAGVGHHRLDEAVAHLGAHRRAAALAHDLGHRLRADAVVEDRGARVLVEDAGGDDRGGGRARDRLRRSRRRGTPGRRRRRRPARRRRPPRATRAWRSRRFSGWIGSAGWFGKVPSSSP